MSYNKQTWTDGPAGNTPVSAARLNTIEAGIFNADFYTCTSTTRPTTGLFDGMRIYETDTKAFGLYDFTNAVWHMWDSVGQSFTPGWISSGAQPSVGTGGTIVGSYRRMGRLCHIRISFTAGGNVNGGNGQLFFTIPSAIQAANSPEQWIPAKIFIPSNLNWQGLAFIQGANVAPYFTAGAGTAYMDFWRSATSGNAVGTGIPLYPGNYSMQASTNLTVEGTYEMAAG